MLTAQAYSLNLDSTAVWFTAPGLLIARCSTDIMPSCYVARFMSPHDKNSCRLHCSAHAQLQSLQLLRDGMRSAGFCVACFCHLMKVMLLTGGGSQWHTSEIPAVISHSFCCCKAVFGLYVSLNSMLGNGSMKTFSSSVLVGFILRPTVSRPVLLGVVPLWGR
jgi:hypothetical protein